MSVIVEFQVSAPEFDLGQILSVDEGSTIELESLVPVDQATVPLFWIHNSTRDSFVDSVGDHPAVENVSVVDVFEDRTLFTLDWDASTDPVFQAIQTADGQLLSATGTVATWEFEVRFPTRVALTDFSAYCEENGITPQIDRIHNPTEPESDPWYGLTEPQREAVLLAMEHGYYDIPRGCTTMQLGEKLGISDQAVTERLRRATRSLLSTTLADSSAEE